jgi:hypothetical protein
VCENITPIPVAGFFGSGKSSEELPEHVKRGFDAAPKSVWDQVGIDSKRFSEITSTPNHIMVSAPCTVPRARRSRHKYIGSLALFGRFDTVTYRRRFNSGGWTEVAF